MLTLLAAVALAEPCAQPVTSQQVAVDLAAARAAFHDLDVDRFHLSLDAAVIAVPCLSDVMPRDEAAELHALQGVRWFVAADERQAVTAFAAAKRLTDDRALIDDLFPVGHAARALWAEANASAILDGQVPVPEVGSTVFDGTPGGRRPEAPTVFQLLDAAGKPIASAWLKPTDALPPYDGKLPKEPGTARKLPLVQLGGTAAFGVVSAALYATAAQREARFDDAQPGWDSVKDVDRYAATTNAASAGSVVALAAAAGFGVWAVVKF